MHQVLQKGGRICISKDFSIIRFSSKIMRAEPEARRTFTMKSMATSICIRSEIKIFSTHEIRELTNYIAWKPNSVTSNCRTDNVCNSLCAFTAWILWEWNNYRCVIPFYPKQEWENERDTRYVSFNARPEIGKSNLKMSARECTTNTVHVAFIAIPNKHNQKCYANETRSTSNILILLRRCISMECHIMWRSCVRRFRQSFSSMFIKWYHLSQTKSIGNLAGIVVCDWIEYLIENMIKVATFNI